MVKIVFGFDTEDYMNPEFADGILWTAQLLRKKGVRGSFNIVGRLAEALVEWGREDIIEELKYHDICLHSHRHSHHPTVNEYTDIEDFEEAKRLFIEDESAGIEKVKKVLGVDSVSSACMPGDSTSYVAYYGYHALGFKTIISTFFDVLNFRPVYACNMISSYPAVIFDRIFDYYEKEDVDKLVEKLSKFDGYCPIIHHPHTSIAAEHTDVLNFNKVNTPKEEWKSAPHLDKEITKKFYENFEYFIDALIAHSDCGFATMEELGKAYDDKGRVLRREDMNSIFLQTYEKFFPVTVPDSFCLADMALACRDFLLGKDEHLCGDVYGFLDEPYTLSEMVKVTREEIIEGAKFFKDGEFLPTKITIGDKTIGPGDWLRAAIIMINGAKQVTLTPRTWQIDLDQFPRVRDLNCKGTWIHCDELEDKYLSKRTRLQTWTVRLPKGTPRTIYPAYDTKRYENIEEEYKNRI